MTLKSLLIGAALALLPSLALAQAQFVTPKGGANEYATGTVEMCLNSLGQAVPVGPSCANGSPTTPAGVTSTMATAAPTAGMFSSLLAASTSRKGCTIQNIGTTLGYIYFGANGSATTSNSFQLPVSGSISCNNVNGTVLQDNVSGTCGSGTCAFIVSSQ